jgi:hypothetical protein
VAPRDAATDGVSLLTVGMRSDGTVASAVDAQPGSGPTTSSRDGGAHADDAPADGEHRPTPQAGPADSSQEPTDRPPRGAGAPSGPFATVIGPLATVREPVTEAAPAPVATAVPAPVAEAVAAAAQAIPAVVERAVASVAEALPAPGAGVLPGPGHIPQAGSVVSLTVHSPG